MIREYLLNKTHAISNPFNKRVDVYLVRHGETDLNRLGVLQGSIEEPLNSYGRDQALQAARVLSQIDIAEVVTSPQIRARETADIISRHLKVSVQENTLLRERDWGIYEGKKREERDATGEGVEPIEALEKRVISAFTAIVTNTQQPCAIVTHSGFIKSLINVLFGEPPSVIKNGEIIRVSNNT